MKTISGKLKILAFAGIILIAAIVIQSCKKSSSPAGPTVSNVTTGANDTVGKSYTLTIVGTNLTGATLSTTATGVTISNVSVTGSTSLTATIAFATSAVPGTVTIVITTTAGTANAQITLNGIPLIGGYVSSDSVAAANLISYFNFDNNVNDIAGSQTGTAVGVTYITGVRGQAYQGATGAYATVPASSAFASLQSFSVSVWYNLPSAAKPQSGQSDPGGMFFVSGDTGTTGANANEILLETDVPSASQLAADSVPIHHGFNNIGGVPLSWQNFTMNSFDTATSTWVHIVMTYNGSSSAYTFYENGQPIAVSSAFGVSTSSILYDGSLPVGSGTPATQLQGNLIFTPAPPKTLIIGTWPPGVYGVSATLGSNGCFQGALDELRVFNTALTQQEVVGLYLNGLAGR